jgi:two-component system sensor histidine kinase/response regulator
VERILIVDDSVVSRRILKTQLEREGYQVAEATSGENALEMLQTETFSLITLDVNMPGISGFDVGHQIIKMQEASGKADHLTPLIFVTGSDTLEERERGFEVGACDFISKAQVPKGELVMAVNRHLKPSHAIDGSRVLLVDDSQVVRKSLERTFSTMGVHADVADSGESALALINKPGVVYDLMIFDCQMPGMDGLQLCTKVRTTLGIRDTPIIFLTGAIDRETQLGCFQVGGTDYIQKPCIREELEARIRVHLGAVARNRMMTKLNARLERTNKALDRFASTAAHDLKSPLATITMAIERLSKKLSSDPDPRTMKLLDMIVRSSEKMTTMVHQLLDYAKGELEQAGQARVDIRALLEDLLDDLQLQVAQKSGVIKLKDRFPVVRGSEGALRSVFQNLLTNAIKYSHPDRSPDIFVNCEEFDDHMLFSVKDNGIGFDPNGVDPFAEFTRLVDDDAPVEGHGVGLATVREIVTNFGGEIWADSEPDVGSTFFVKLPNSMQAK